MSNPHDLSDGRAVTHDPYVPALDGLRGLAALLVAGAHYMTMEGGAPLSEIVQTLTGLGMTLFFVLSGFVIHYNYNATITRPGGLRLFFVARFARLYPLYIILILFDFAYTGLTARGACGQIGAPGEHWTGRGFARYWRRGARRCLRHRTAEQSGSAARFRRQIELMDLRIVAAAPIDGKVLAAAGDRIADLDRVDGEQAGGLGIIAGARRRRRDIADLHQISPAGWRHEVLAGQAVGSIDNMDHASVRILRGQPVVENLHGGKKRYRHNRKAPDHHEQDPTDRRPHGRFFSS
jgi:hypothetical protein